MIGSFEPPQKWTSWLGVVAGLISSLALAVVSLSISQLTESVPVADIVLVRSTILTCLFFPFCLRHFGKVRRQDLKYGLIRGALGALSWPRRER